MTSEMLHVAKTRSPATTGDDALKPGSLVIQAMFFVVAEKQGVALDPEGPLHYAYTAIGGFWFQNAPPEIGHRLTCLRAESRHIDFLRSLLRPRGQSKEQEQCERSRTHRSHIHQTPQCERQSLVFSFWPRRSTKQ